MRRVDSIRSNNWAILILFTDSIDCPVCTIDEARLVLNKTMQTRSNQSPISIWQYKPWWCQPWSILLTGIVLIVGSWLLIKTVWVTVLVAIPVLAWMSYFLLIYPKLIAESGLLQTELLQIEVLQTETEKQE